MESERRRIGEVHRSIHLIIAREGAFDASVTDDGACDHLPGLKMPSLVLPSTAGRLVDLSKRDAARTIVYCYSMTGVPGAPLPEGWDLIPGARGCIPQACAFRDHYQELATFEAELFGLSTQPTRLSARNGRTLASAVRNPERCRAHLCERFKASHIRGRGNAAYQAPNLDYPWRPDRNRVFPRLSVKRERRASPRVA